MNTRGFITRQAIKQAMSKYVFRHGNGNYSVDLKTHTPSNLFMHLILIVRITATLHWGMSS